MGKTIFTGAATAIITPMDADGLIDYEAYGRMLDWQISESIDAILVAGTTGESATLKIDEHKRLVSFTVDRVAGRVPVIAGTGTNDTSHALELTKNACDAGVDAVLVVTPYYNKTTQQGLIRNFGVIGDASTVPLVLYNVPSRTGVNILPETYDVLADHGNIQAVKEANGDIVAVADTARLVEGRMDIYSGNDDQIVPILSLGGKGVISVLSNIAPRATHDICSRFFSGDTAGSCRMQLDYMPLIHALFSEVNPIPVKAACAELGFGANSLRLPLVTMTDSRFAKLKELMAEAGVVVRPMPSDSV